ncbi:retrovirus-related pol polyprotein from transposon TNT 1-94, partial [Tanacetum coccineum]
KENSGAKEGTFSISNVEQNLELGIEHGKNVDGQPTEEKPKRNRFKYDSTGSYAVNLPEDNAPKRAKEAWEVLKQEFQGDVKVRAIKLQTLRRDYENTKMKENESLNDYSSRLTDLINQMKSYGDEIEDQRIFEKILIKLLSSLKSYEQRMTRHSGKAIESAFQSSLQGDKRPQSNFRRGSSSRGGHGGRNFRGRERRQSYGRGQGNFDKRSFGDGHSYKCSIFKKDNHEEKDCWHKGKYKCTNYDQFGHLEKFYRQKNQQANFLEEKQEDGNVFFCHSANIERSDTWFLDSGCSNHMTGDESILVDIDTAGNSQVKMGNEAVVQSISFPITFRYEEHTALKATTTDEALLWHMTLGYLNFQSLNLLHRKNMVGGLPQIHKIEVVCEGCALGKHHRKPFPKGVAWRAKDILELVHTDLCGPMRNPSHANNLYFIIFIDDFSRLTWVYFMKEKSQFFGIFKKFENFVEKQTRIFIKILRSDQGKEYNSKEFDKFCEDESMHRQLTTRYIPRQNGVVKRKNHTVVEMAKSMMHEKGLPKSFWAEAVYTAIYLLNRSPTKALDNKTPLEAWNRRKPSVRHLKVFGCVCYSQIPKQKRYKLDETSEKCIFVGYSSKLKAYRLYSLKTKNVIVSRDVIFDENSSWNWEEEKKEGTSFSTNNMQDEAHVESDENQPSHDEVPNEEPDEESQSPPPRKFRSLAEIYNANFCHVEPDCFEEAIKEESWKKAMEDEIQVIEKNNTWELTDRPSYKDVIGVKWVYKIKYNADGSVQRNKARLVTKGYSQQLGIDYDETFARVAQMDTVRAIISLADPKGWLLYQLDVKSAFLNGELKEEVYVNQPQGFEVEGKEEKVYKLKKALYGLKQAPQAWYSQIDGYFKEKGFDQSESEPTLYVKNQGTSDILIVALYVNDLVFTGNNKKMIEDFKNEMMQKYEMSDLGILNHFLGMEIYQDEDGVFICQENYVEKILKIFGMSEFKPKDTPLVVNEKLMKEDGSSKVDDTLHRSLVGK